MSSGAVTSSMSSSNPAESSAHHSQEKRRDMFEALPEEPLQLVRPDPREHRKLEIVEKHLKALHHVKSAVAVIAVVGKFHSGKSFLLNQLMGKKNGFGIGPTVRPQTMGIWMWGKVSGVMSGCGLC